MLTLARKNLFSERARLGISVWGITLSVFLISLLLALYRGWDSKVAGFVEDSNIDVWMASEGTTDFLSAASVLPAELGERVSTEATVDRWGSLIVRPLSGVKVTVPRPADFDEERARRMDLQFIGYDPESGLGGPLEIVQGKERPGAGEMIIDEELGHRYGVDLGDNISAGGRDWKIVGVSRGGNFVASQTVFVDLEEARDVLNMEGLATFIVLTSRTADDSKPLADRLEARAPAVRVFTRQEFAEATRERALSNVLPMLLMVLVLAFIVGLAVAGLTIYTATIEKAREYGILKALGFRNSFLYGLVFEQSVLTAVLGFVMGIGLTLLFGSFAADLVPQFVVLVRWQDTLVVLGATLVMAAIAGYIPVRRIGAIDPTAVFKA